MTDRSLARNPAGVARVLPIVGWLPRYQRSWLRPDLIAGVTVAALVVLFGVLVWPVILSGGGGTSEASDQVEYHLPAIDGMVQQWPFIDVVDYPSATAPGYHFLMATLSRFVSCDPMVLQLASSLLSLGFLLVVWHHAARLVRPPAALALVLPLLASSYVLGAAIWLDTDNAALLFVALALGGSALVEATPLGGFRLALYGTAAVLVRPIPIWVGGDRKSVG